MKKSITLRAFPPGMSTEERLALAREANFEGVEVNLEPAEEYTLTASDHALARLRRQVEAHDLAVSAVYCREQWRYPITSQNGETRRRGIEIIERLVHAATVLGTDAVLVVPGAVDNRIFVTPPEIVPYDVAYHTALETIQQLSHGICAQAQVVLALENVWNKFLLSPLEMAQFVDAAASRWVGVYFDVGNVLRTGFPEHWIRILAGRIRRVHFKDFRLGVDNLGGFVGLLQGDVDWPAVRKALEGIGYQSWITGEVLPPYKFHGERLIFETSACMDAIWTTNSST
jgi:L-ribulose-5-phosphate 3-epimerase